MSLFAEWYTRRLGAHYVAGDIPETGDLKTLTYKHKVCLDSNAVTLRTETQCTLCSLLFRLDYSTFKWSRQGGDWNPRFQPLSALDYGELPSARCLRLSSRPSGLDRAARVIGPVIDDHCESLGYFGFHYHIAQCSLLIDCGQAWLVL